MHSDEKPEMEVLERGEREQANADIPQVGGDMEKHDGHQVMS